jgi:hypothetical protein
MLQSGAWFQAPVTSMEIGHVEGYPKARVLSVRSRDLPIHELIYLCSSTLNTRAGTDSSADSTYSTFAGRPSKS